MVNERIEKEAQLRRWRQQADECRTEAAETKSPQARQNLLDVARAYDNMAERAARPDPQNDGED